MCQIHSTNCPYLHLLHSNRSTPTDVAVRRRICFLRSLNLHGLKTISTLTAQISPQISTQFHAYAKKMAQVPFQTPTYMSPAS